MTPRSAVGVMLVFACLLPASLKAALGQDTKQRQAAPGAPRFET